MLSRVAENLYWIARYAERAEGLARLLEDAYSLELEAGSLAADPRPLDNVLLMLDAKAMYAETAPTLAGGGHAANDDRDALLHFMTFHRPNGVSIRSLVAQARENARGTQEALSGEAWSQLNKLHLYLSSERADRRFAASPARFLDRVRRECMLFTAMIRTTMPRTEPFHFLQVGRYLERVDMLSRILNVHCHAVSAETVANGFATTHWVSLLRGTAAYESYLKQSREHVDPVSAVQYLLLEADFPRSMRFAIDQCLASLRVIARTGAGHGAAAERHLGRLESDLRYMDVDELFGKGIGPFLVGVQETCAAVGKDIHHAYFRT